MHWAEFVQAFHSCVQCFRARRTLGGTFTASPRGEAEGLSCRMLMAVDVSDGEDTALFCSALTMSLRDSTGISGCTCAGCTGSENQSETQRVALQWSLPTTTHVAIPSRSEQSSLPTSAHLAISSRWERYMETSMQNSGTHLSSWSLVERCAKQSAAPQEL